MKFFKIYLCMLVITGLAGQTSQASGFMNATVQMNLTKSTAFDGTNKIGKQLNVKIAFSSNYCAVQFEDQSQLNCTNTGNVCEGCGDTQAFPLCFDVPSSFSFIDKFGAENVANLIHSGNCPWSPFIVFVKNGAVSNIATKSDSIQSDDGSIIYQTVNSLLNKGP